MFDCQRLWRSSDIASAPFLAASIFLDVLNVFLIPRSSPAGRSASRFPG